MTLPATGPLTVSMINTELGRVPAARFHLNGADERALAGVPTGAVSFADFYGKSKGFPTPDASYPDPNTVTATQAWAAITPSCIASVTFNIVGTITSKGTVTTPLPPKWYQSGSPPPGYSIIFSLVSSTFAGDPDVRGTIVNTGLWFPMNSDWEVYANLYKATAPTISTTMTATFDVGLSNGTAVIVTFRLICSVTLT